MTMSKDIFSFWAEIGPARKIHPRDKAVLARIKNHGFNLECLPHCFAGPLRTAKVVLLYLSPGLDKFDLREARSPAGRRRMMESRRGYRELPGPDEHEAAWKWWRSRTQDFGDWEEIRSKVAVLNIGAYHSKQLPNTSVLAALPTSRFTLDWAQAVLFPQAIHGKPIVVCLRAARFWGLDTGKNGKRYGKALFAPRTTRAGHMCKLPLREEILRKARAAIKSA